MPCLDPLHGFIIGKKNNNKNDIIITSKKIDHVEIKNGKLIFCNSYETRTDGKVYRNYIDVPCGKCLSCRLDKARDWTCRCLLEAQQHEKNCFVTLTYDDVHVPRVMYGSSSTGEVCGDAYTLCRRDVQLFLKRLRKALGDEKIRYFGCGEYGDTTARPHYHLLLFGFMPSDVKFYSRSGGNPLWTSKFLSDLWGKGHVVIGWLTPKSVSYTARYTTKKLYGDDSEYYKRTNLSPPFLCCSLRPAIGRDYLEKHLLEIFDAGEIVISTEDGGKRFPIPRYAFKLFQDLYPEKYDAYLKKLGEDVILSRSNFRRLTKQNYYDNLEVKLRNLEARTKSLVRNRV